MLYLQQVTVKLVTRGSSSFIVDGNRASIKLITVYENVVES